MLSDRDLDLDSSLDIDTVKDKWGDNEEEKQSRLPSILLPLPLLVYSRPTGSLADARRSLYKASGAFGGFLWASEAFRKPYEGSQRLVDLQ